jgi:hypothetical protein
MAESNISKDQERLAKLWDAYEIQEKELELSMKKISTLESKISELDRVNDVMKKAMEDRDKEIRDLELKVISLEEENSKFTPQLTELTKLYQEEKDRYSKLFSITEELEEELENAKTENEIKDKWFDRNVGMLENLRESIVERNIQLKESSEAPKAKAETDTTSTIEKPTKTLAKPVETSTPSPESSSTVDAPAKDESITFKKVDIEAPSQKPDMPNTTPPSTGDTATTTTTTSMTPPTPGATFGEDSTKNEIIYEFSKIPDVDPLIAESLYIAGFTNLDKLKSATMEELANIDGISPTLARKIRTNLFEMN